MLYNDTSLRSVERIMAILEQRGPIVIANEKCLPSRCFYGNFEINKPEIRESFQPFLSRDMLFAAPAPFGTGEGIS